VGLGGSLNHCIRRDDPNDGNVIKPPRNMLKHLDKRLAFKKVRTFSK
jgi:hypothetical protein